jgi:hypothetical protein
MKARESLTEQIENSASAFERCFAMSLNDSIRDLSFELKRRGVAADAVAMCTAHFREHSDRTFAFFASEYRIHLGDLATRIERWKVHGSTGRAPRPMTELWAHVQEPHCRLQCGLHVYVADWQIMAEIQRTGARLWVAPDGQLHVNRPEKLTEWQATWLLDNESTVTAILDDDSRRSTLQ